MFSNEHTVNTTLPIGIYFGLNGVWRVFKVFSDDNRRLRKYGKIYGFSFLAKFIFSHFCGIVFLFNTTRLNMPWAAELKHFSSIGKDFRKKGMPKIGRETF